MKTYGDNEIFRINFKQIWEKEISHRCHKGVVKPHERLKSTEDEKEDPGFRNTRI